MVRRPGSGDRCGTRGLRLHDGRARGRRTVTVPVGGLASDSLGAARVGDHTFPIVRDRVDRMALVTEDQIRDAQRALWDDVRLIVEPGGAAAFAALRSGAIDVSSGDRVCVVLSGGNCDPSTVTPT